MKLKIEHFNGVGRRLAREIGVHETYVLLEKFGGQRFWVSEHPKPTSATSIKLGFKAHQILALDRPDKEVELPMLSLVIKRMEIEQRNAAIIEDSRHLSMRELIKKYEKTRTQLQNIIRDQCDDDQENEAQKTTSQQLQLLDF